MTPLHENICIKDDECCLSVTTHFNSIILCNMCIAIL